MASRDELLADWLFAAEGVFQAKRAAEAALTAAGFSYGRSERGSPRGVLFGDFDIQKWRNLNRQERADLHGEIVGDGRVGPVIVRWRAGLSPAARDAALAAQQEHVAP